MRTILETSQIPTHDKKNFMRRIVESLNIDQDSITAKIKDEKFDFFSRKLKNIIELSGIDNSEILTFEMTLAPQTKSITLTGDMKQAAKVLFQEDAISQETYQKAMDAIFEMEFNKLVQSINPDKLVELCLGTLRENIYGISDITREKTTKSVENLLDGLKNTSLKNRT